MWRLRTFGWTVLAMGIASFTLIPYLRWANRDDEVTEAIVAGVIGIALGLAIVKFLTKPEP